jgi:hypothetical protein
MEVLILDDLYVGLVDGKLVASTREEGLEKARPVCAASGPYTRVAFYCPTHDHIDVFYKGDSEFHVESAKKARDCDEFNFFKRLWFVHRNLAKAILADDKELIAKTVRRLTKKHIEELLARENVMRKLLERLDDSTRAELESRLVQAKLEG